MKRFLFGLLVTPFILNAAPAQTAEVVKEVDGLLKSLRTEDEALRQALAAHPDIMVATAKLRVAEAELAQVKLLVAQRVTNLKSDLDVTSVALSAHEKMLAEMNVRHKAGNVAQAEVQQLLIQVTQIRSKAARLKAEYDSLTKPAAGSTSGIPYSIMLNRPQEGLATAYGQSPVAADQWAGLATTRWVNLPLVPGSPAEKLRAVLDRPVKLDVKSKPAGEIIRALMKNLNSDLTVRMPNLEPGILKDTYTSVSVSGEMTLVPWLEFILDEINSKLPNDAQNEAYVREYGLLIAPRSSTPKDAVTLRQFAAQVRAEKAAKERTQP